MNKPDPFGLYHAERKRKARDWKLICYGVCAVVVAAMMVWM